MRRRRSTKVMGVRGHSRCQVATATAAAAALWSREGLCGIGLAEHVPRSG